MKLTNILHCACVSLLGLLLLLCGCSTQARWQEQYDLGMRYLAESDYQQAILAFTEAIIIDEKRPEAYFGRGQSYYGLVNMLNSGVEVDFVVEGENQDNQLSYCYEQAILDYEKSIELNPENPEYYDAIMMILLECGDIERMIHYGEQKYQKTADTGLKNIFDAAKTSLALLDELAKAFDEGDDENVFSLMQGEEYDRLLSLQEYLGEPILLVYNSQTLGVYRVETPKYGHCMIYYGSYIDGVRSGEGAWYGYADGNNYASHGEWANDMPNGRFETKEWYSSLSESVFYRLVSGGVIDGLWDGSILWAFDQKDGTYLSWACTFHNGQAEIVNIGEVNGTTRYIWSEQNNNGEYANLGVQEGEQDRMFGIEGFAPVYDQ